MKYLKAAFLEARAMYERLKAASQDTQAISQVISQATPSDEPSAGDETPSERQSKTRWQLWSSVSEVMNAPANVPVDWFVCHTNRVLWSMSIQGYDRTDGKAFLDEVARLGKFSESHIKRARQYINKYWKGK